MVIKFNTNEYFILAEILSKPYDEMGSYPWKEYMEDWIEDLEPEDLINLIIQCFFTFYGPPNLKKEELKKLICETPLHSLGQYLLPEPSLEDPRSIFAEWRVSINK